MYKVFVNIPNGEQQVFELEENENVNCLKSRICESGIKFEDISLVHGGKMLEGEDLIMSENADVECNVALRGGAAKKVVDPIIAEMAKKYRLNKKICRKCYAHLDPKATVCRKRRCGHWADIRMKKLMTEGGK